MAIRMIMAIVFLFSVSTAWGKIKVEDIQFINLDNSSGTIALSYKGRLTESTDLSVKGKILQISIPDAQVWPSIEKTIRFENGETAKITAYQFNKDVVRLRGYFPFSLDDLKNKISIGLGKRNLKVYFPLKIGKMAALESSPNKEEKKTVHSTSPKYDEALLEELLADREKMAQQNKEEASRPVETDKAMDKNIKSILSSIDKEEKKNEQSFSILSYAGKMIFVLCLVLALFYGIVHFLKKGMNRKGKIGFLNELDPVKVLSTTYLGPKKNLHLIQANKQIFLVASSDKGVHYLSEVETPSQVFKEGEKLVTGNNFDTRVTQAEKEEREFLLKEDIMSSSEEVTPVRPVKSKPMMRDKIRHKMKNLRPLDH